MDNHACVMPECISRRGSRGLCHRHYQSERRLGNLLSHSRLRDDKPQVMSTACAHTNRKHCANGLCRSCYNSEKWKSSPIVRRATECEHPDRKHAAKGLCKSCYTRKWMREHPDAPGTGNNWLREHPEEARLHRRRSGLKKLHGMTIAEYDAMWHAQGGKCANKRCSFSAPIMMADFRENGLLVDHDHATGKRRGLLCRPCNIALGHAKDDIKRLAGLIEYLSSGSGD